MIVEKKCLSSGKFWCRVVRRVDSMKVSVNSGYLFIGLLLLVLAGGCSLQNENRLTLDEWERGFVISPGENQEMKMFLWFYEWHLFDAVKPGIHTHGYGRPGDWSIFTRSINESRAEGFMEKNDMRLDVVSVDDDIEMVLTIRNTSNHDWPEIAAIIPCFNPGPPPNRSADGLFRRTDLFIDMDSTHTYFIGPEEITPLNNRSIHFSHLLRPQVEKVRRESGPFIFDGKWPTSPVDAYKSLMVRESLDGKWVTGIAWENCLSAQGHNPWQCMHLSILVGPLKQGEKKEIRGKIYLFKGSKEDCYKRYLADFKSQ